MARKVAAAKGVGLTQAVHEALRHELEQEQEKPDLVELSIAFAQALRAEGRPDLGQPADKDFIDGLYENDWCSSMPLHWPQS